MSNKSNKSSKSSEGEEKKMDDEPPIALNLGCGKNILPSEQGWINVDGMKNDGVDVVFDLDDCRTSPLPFDDDSVSVVLLSHVMEHLHHTLPLMDEVYRVCKSDAKIIIRTPHGASDDAWEDPTHLRGYFPSSFEYFSQPMYWRADYGYKGDFKSEVVNLYIENKVLLDDTNEEIIRKVMHERNWVSEMEAVLTCIKPARKADKQLRSAPRLQILKRGTDLNPEGQNGIGAQGKQMKEVRKDSNDSNDSNDKDNVELVD